MAIQKIAVIGAGKLGRSITCSLLRAGCATVLEDVSQQSLANGTAWIEQELQQKASMEKSENVDYKKALALLSTAANVEDAIRDADLIIEAVPDELEMKLELFTIFDKFAKPGAIFVSTSAAHLVSDISDVAVFRERCVGLRFHNLGSEEEFIEIVKTPLTSEETLKNCQEVAQRMTGRVTIASENTNKSSGSFSEEIRQR